MKGKQLFLLLIGVGALVAAWLNLSKTNQAEWGGSSREGSKVLEFPINNVAQIAIKVSGAELNLVRKNEMWTVQERADYPANFEEVSRLLRKLWDLKAVQEVKVGESQMARLRLLEPGNGEDPGTLLQLRGADGKEIRSLLLGKVHLRKAEDGAQGFAGAPSGIPVGRYVKAGGGTRVCLVGDTLQEVNTRAEPWLAREFLSVDGPKSITVSGPRKWSVSRENPTAEWQLGDAKPGEKLDAAKTTAFGNLLTSANFTDVVALSTKGEVISFGVIETFDGFRYELQLGKEVEGTHPVFVQVSGTFLKERVPAPEEKPEDKARLDGEFLQKLKRLEEKLAREKKFEGWGYLVSKMHVESLLKDRAGLLVVEKPAEPVKPAEAPKAAEPAKPADVPKPIEVPKGAE